MLASWTWVWVSVYEREIAGEAKSNEICRAGAELGGWGGVGVISSTSPALA